MAQKTYTQMMLTTFLWHGLQVDLFETSSVADCTNARPQERPSQTVANLHAKVYQYRQKYANLCKQHNGAFALQLNLCQQMWLDTAVTINLTGRSRSPRKSHVKSQQCIACFSPYRT